MRRDVRELPAAAVLLVAMACTGASAPALTSDPTLATQRPSPSAARATQRPALSPAATPAESAAARHHVLPGEPWIAYMWGVEEAESVGIMVVRPDGTDAHWAEPEAPIAAGVGGGDGWQLHPDWSRDGSQLAFGIDVWPYEDGHRDIWISDANGDNARRAYDCIAPCDSAQSPAWSPDDQSVLFARLDHANRISDGSALDLVNVASGEVATVAETKGADYFAFPRWSPDATRVVVQIETWSNITEDSELVSTSIAVVDLTVSPATVAKITEPEAWANYPDWHPADDRIVYVRRPEGEPASGNYDLYVMDPDGGNATVLVDHELNAVQPTWLPDGSGVMFVLVEGEDFTTATMWVVDADGSNLRPATDTDEAPGGSHPRLRPTGR